MISASALLRHCGHPRHLNRIPPKDAAERKREASKQASADLGSQFHTAVDAWCKGAALHSDNPEVMGWLDGLATVFLPRLGVETELAWGLTLDGVYCPVDEPEPHVYVPSRQFFGHGEPIPPLLTAGRADVAWEDEGFVWCPDLKTGRWPVTPARSNLQANASGMALASRVEASGYVPGIYYARDNYFDWGEPVTLGSPEHRAMFKEVEAAAMLDETPRPGPHVCPSCWDRKRCAAAHKETP